LREELKDSLLHEAARPVYDSMYSWFVHIWLEHYAEDDALDTCKVIDPVGVSEIYTEWRNYVVAEKVEDYGGSRTTLSGCTTTRW